MFRCLVCAVGALTLTGTAAAAQVDPGWGSPRGYSIDVSGMRPIKIPEHHTKPDPGVHGGCRWVTVPPGPKGPGGRFWVC